MSLLTVNKIFNRLALTTKQLTETGNAFVLSEAEVWLLVETGDFSYRRQATAQKNIWFDGNKIESM